MGDADSVDMDSFAFIAGVASMSVGTLVTLVLLGIVAWLITRAVSVIPREQSGINVGRFWGLFVLWLLMNVALVPIAALTYQQDGDGGPSPLVPICQFVVGVFTVWGIFWIALRVPAAFKTAFASYSEQMVSMGNHGRIQGLCLAILAAVATIGSFVGSLALGLGNPLSVLQRQTDGMTGVSPGIQPGELVLSCGSGILGIAMLVLMIIFLVQITNSRTALLRLQHETEDPSSPGPPPALNPGRD